LTNRTLKRLSAISLTVLCSACGTVKLADTIVPHDTKTSDQQQIDILTCKDQAKLAVSSAGRQTGDFFLGLSVVGIPLAIAMDNAKQREVFASCMATHGYTTTLGSTTVPAAGASKVTASDDATVPSVPDSKVGFTMPPGWTKSTQAAGSVGMLKGINKTIDAGFLLEVAQRDGITDTMAYAITLRANQVGRLANATPSEIVTMEVGGRKAYRFTVAGELKSKGAMDITYQTTVIEGASEIAVVNVWTGSANFELRHEAMAQLAVNVTGL
jgi:ribosomal protein L32